MVMAVAAQNQNGLQRDGLDVLPKRQCLRDAPAVVAHNGKYGEAVPQIFTKAAVLHHGGQILVGRSYNAHIYRDRVFAANALKDTFLYNS